MNKNNCAKLWCQSKNWIENVIIWARIRLNQFKAQTFHMYLTPPTLPYTFAIYVFISLNSFASRGLEEKKFWKIQVVALFDKRFVPVALINILGEWSMRGGEGSIFFCNDTSEISFSYKSKTLKTSRFESN